MTRVSIFTPHMPDGTTAIMRLSPEEMSEITLKVAARRPWTAIVTDLDTNRRWRVRDADCGLGCRCAAEVVLECIDGGKS